MSATKVKNRTGKFLDFYETPERVVNGLIDTGFFDSIDIRNVLEPCAGNGAIIRAVRKCYPGLKITAVEIQECFSESLGSLGIEVIIDDFLKRETGQIYDSIIANPPFSQAQEFIHYCFACLRDQGRMAFLLRLPFIASVKRYELFDLIHPSFVHVLSQRPKFGGNNIDSCDYAWVVWEKGKCEPIRQQTILTWIPPS